MTLLAEQQPSPSLALCHSAGKINELQLKNRFIKAATFENMTPEGRPTASLAHFHGQLAEGGIAMTTIGYCAVENDGRLNDRMMFMGEHIFFFQAEDGIRVCVKSLESRRGLFRAHCWFIF